MLPEENKMSIINFATQDAFSWDTMHTLDMPNVYSQLLSPIQQATPTFRIFWKHKQSKALGPEAKFQIPMIVKALSPSMAKQNYVFDTQSTNPLTMQEWSPVAMANGAGSNDVEWQRCTNNLSRFNLIDIKVDAIHQGLTTAMNFLLWWDWVETDISASQIDINSQLSTLTNPPEELYLKNITQASEAPYSIPMLTRKVVTGYTLGNIPVTTTGNKYFHPVNTDGDAAAITRSVTGSNVDCVTAIDSTLCKPLDIDDINTHVGKISQAWQYHLYAACPFNLYSQLRNIIMTMNTRDHASPLADLGINAAITYNEFNIVFYHEPIMDALWPYSIFFYDPTCIYLVYEEGFDPRVYPWKNISGTNMLATAVYESYQLVRPDAQGVSAMHGYTNG